jgi:NAD(P)H-nitrite reductase large subunit
MNVDVEIVQLVDYVLQTTTGKSINHLQVQILSTALTHKPYSEVAILRGCTEGHVRDVASESWRALSQYFDCRISKANAIAILQRCLADFSELEQVSNTSDHNKARARKDGHNSSRDRSPFNPINRKQLTQLLTERGFSEQQIQTAWYAINHSRNLDCGGLVVRPI